MWVLTFFKEWPSVGQLPVLAIKQATYNFMSKPQRQRPTNLQVHLSPHARAWFDDSLVWLVTAGHNAHGWNMRAAAEIETASDSSEAGLLERGEETWSVAEPGCTYNHLTASLSLLFCLSLNWNASRVFGCGSYAENVTLIISQILKRTKIPMKGIRCYSSGRPPTN